MRCDWSAIIRFPYLVKEVGREKAGMERGSWGGAGKGSRISWGQEYGDQGKIG